VRAWMMAPASRARRSLLAALLWAAAALAPPLAAQAPARPSPPRAAGGLLDLSAWDFSRSGAVPLAGEWEFYPGRLLGSGEEAGPAESRIVPDRWRAGEAGGTEGRGAGTYRLRLLLPQGGPGLGIRIPTVSTAFELEADGIAIASAGKPALLASEASAGCFTEVCRLPERGPGSSRELELLVRVSNHEYRQGGLWAPFLLGAEEELRAGKRGEDWLTLAFFGVAVSAAAFVYLLFRRRQRERGNLYFASFALVIALRALVTGNYLLAAIFPGLPFGALIRLSYFTAFAPLPLCILFFGSVFPEEIGPRARLLACAPFCALGLLLAAPLPLLTRSIYLLYPLLLLVMLPTIVLGLGRAYRRKRPGSGPMLAASVFLALAGIVDMLSSSILMRSANVLFPGLVLFIFVQASILARRFAAAIDAEERLSAQLAAANDGLDRQVKERTRELEEAYARIKGLSIKDPLTGAFNRRYLDAELLREAERAIRYGLPLSLLFCDFDRFKAINDEHGHGAGDEVLRSFARIALRTIRANVDWLARYGGEEFLVVAPGTRASDAARLAERLRSQAEAEPARAEGASIPYTLSIGVAGLELCPGPEACGSDAAAFAASLVARADEAMYAAKAAGRNRVELAPR